jgi:para-nitrobenzyl esterase
MNAPTASISSGTIRGVQLDDLACFRGIPFARPPLGELRWKAPEPVEPWQGVRDCVSFGDSAMQGSLGGLGDMIGVAAGPVSEDCLYLNVWTPGLDAQRRPVMVWIHGGGNVVGSGAQPRIDGQHLARRGDVVVVTLNYRLGAFGFLHAPELGATGNEALLDQIAALRWVRREIEQFGGNSEQVTVFGQSAGGFDIAELMALPEAAGCFDAAIPMSGSIGRQVSAEQGLEIADRFAEHFGGCTGLREISAADILEHQLELTGGELGGSVRFGPVRDGVLIKAEVEVALGAGTHTCGMPLLIGHTANEWGLWAAMNRKLARLDDEALRDNASRVFGARTDDAIEIYYSSAPNLTPLDVWTQMMTDVMFRIPAIRMAELHSEHTPQTWMYRFDHPSPALEGRLGACHSIDIPFVWGTCDTENMPRFCGAGDAADALSNVMMDTYLAFARHHDPNNAHLPAWPGYTSAERQTMRLESEPGVVSDPGAAVREFWAAL